MYILTIELFIEVCLTDQKIEPQKAEINTPYLTDPTRWKNTPGEKLLKN